MFRVRYMRYPLESITRGFTHIKSVGRQYNNIIIMYWVYNNNNENRNTESVILLCVLRWTIMCETIFNE